MPTQDFIVLQLAPENVEAVFKDVVMAAGLKHAIRHVQIEKHGNLEFGSYDNFQHLVTGPGVTPELLLEQKSNGVVWDFEIAQEVGHP